MAFNAYTPAVSRGPTDVLGRSFWFVQQAQFSLVFLFFGDEPRVATLLATGMAVLFLVIVARSPTTVATSPTWANFWVYALVAWAGLSLFWTSAPVAGLNYWIALTASTVAAGRIARAAPDVETAVGSACWGLFWGAVCLALITLTTLDPDNTLARLGDPVSLHPNVIGNRLALGGLAGGYLILAVRLRFGRHAIAYALLMVCFLLTFSKTSLIAWVTAGLIFLMLMSVARRARITAIVSLALGAAAAYGGLRSRWEDYAQVGDGRALETLSGRTVLWPLVREAIADRPVMGYGIHSFESAGPQPFSISIGSAHNELLNLAFNFGIIGLALGVMVYMSCVYRGIRARLHCSPESKNLGALLIAFTVYFLVRGFTEADPVALAFPLPLVIVLFYASGTRGFGSRQSAADPDSLPATKDLRLG